MQAIGRHARTSVSCIVRDLARRRCTTAHVTIPALGHDRRVKSTFFLSYIPRETEQKEPRRNQQRHTIDEQRNSLFPSIFFFLPVIFFSFDFSVIWVRMVGSLIFCPLVHLIGILLCVWSCRARVYRGGVTGRRGGEGAGEKIERRTVPCSVLGQIVLRKPIGRLQFYSFIYYCIYIYSCTDICVHALEYIDVSMWYLIVRYRQK